MISSPSQDIEALQREIEQLRAENEALRAETERLYRIVEDEPWVDDLFRLSNKIISPMHKLSLWAYRKTWPTLSKNDFGLGETNARDLAPMIGGNPDNILEALARAKTLGIIKKPKPYREKLINEDGKPILDKHGKQKYISKLFTCPTDEFDDVASWPKHTQPELLRAHGGPRTKREIPTCPTCGLPADKEHATLHCPNNHTWEVHTDFEAEAESLKCQDAISDDDAELAAIFDEVEPEPEELPSEMSRCHPTEERERQDAISDSYETGYQAKDVPITAAPTPLDWHATLTAWLEKRIGEHIEGEKRIVAATGKLEYRRKYYYKDETYIPDIAAYLRGDSEHIYGGRMDRANGSTWFLTGDFDDKHPEHDARHVEFMTRLAAAGIASLYFQRRPGRGHIEIYFTRLVDALSARQWIISIVPELATAEWFPYGKQPVSWPFYQRIGNTVTECAVEAMHPDRPGSMGRCKGVRSEPKKLAELIRRCETDASLVPPRKVEATQPQVARLLDKSFPTRKRGYSGWQTDLIEEFNRAHSWHDVASWCGGFDDRGYFRATWRPGNGGRMGERTPSVKPDGPDSRYCCDYGDGYRKYDKYGIWCKVKDIDPHDDLKARRTALREAVSA
jgi:hypothetical protein